MQPAPLTVQATAVLEVPVTFAINCWLLPTTSVALFGFTVIATRAVFPDSGRFIARLEALEVKAKLPLALPADCGAKTTEKVALWPAPSVRGKAKPLRVKPVPVRVA
jgi:hypothetical protein